jgi:hypothetical protein
VALSQHTAESLWLSGLQPFFGQSLKKSGLIGKPEAYRTG